MKWTAPLAIGPVTEYVIYTFPSSDAANRSHFGNVTRISTGEWENATVGTNLISVPVDFASSHITHFMVYSASALAEMTTPSPHRIYDAVASATGTDFLDQDLPFTGLHVGSPQTRESALPFWSVSSRRFVN